MRGFPRRVVDHSAWLSVVGSAFVGAAWVADLLLDAPTIELPSSTGRRGLATTDPVSPNTTGNGMGYRGTVSPTENNTLVGVTAVGEAPHGSRRPGKGPLPPVVIVLDGEIRGHHFVIRGLRNGKVDF
jgi:hypothetical protein